MDSRYNDWKVVFSWDTNAHSLDNFRSMFYEDEDWERIGRKPLEKALVNRIAITLEDSKVGKYIATWACSNPILSSPICPVRSLFETFLIRDRMGEGWSRDSFLFAFNVQHPDVKKTLGTSWSLSHVHV